MKYLISFATQHNDELLSFLLAYQQNFFLSYRCIFFTLHFPFLFLEL